MTQQTLKLTERIALLEKELSEKEISLKIHSRKVSETQVLIIELRGEIKGLKKISNLINK